MKMFSKMMLSALAFAGASLGAAEAVTYNKVADWQNEYKNTEKFFSDTKEGFQCKSDAVKTNFRTFGKKLFPVVGGKKYKVSFEYRLIPGGEDSARFHFGIHCVDKNGRGIEIREVNFHKDTLTALTAPVKKGDKVLKVKDASKWQPRYAHAAFGAKADASDLPNRELSPQIIKMEKTGDCWTLTLKAPMMKDYPAGTAVRNHADGGTFRYIAGAAEAKSQWTTCSRVFHDFAVSDWEVRGDSFRAGTASITPVFFPSSYAPFNIEFRNVKIEEVK